MAQHRTHFRRKKKQITNTKINCNQRLIDNEICLPPEDDLGNVEYKSQLIKPTTSRLQHLITQMKWRIHEGQGESYYILGVQDDGTMTGLTSEEMAESMHTLHLMASDVGANLFILNERCVHGTPGSLNSRGVAEVLVRKLPADQHFIDIRIAILGSASCGKSTLCGVLTQGCLDNGNGKCRLNLLRYMHEVRTGKTSSVTLDVFGFTANGEVVNYKNNNLKEVLERSAKLITLIDSAGDRKYLKTTIYGLSGHAPHYCALLVNARTAWTKMTDEHWDIASAFNIPIFIMINKVDLVSEERVKIIFQQIKSKVHNKNELMEVKHVENEDEAINCATRIITTKILPIFTLSNVTGKNHDLLTKFLNRLPLRNLNTSNVDNENNPLLYVDEVFKLPDTGTVVYGLMAGGKFIEGDRVQIGPDQAGNYQMAKVLSLHRNKQSVLIARAGETASLAIEFANKTNKCKVRKGMVILSAKDTACGYRRFTVRFCLLSHSVKELCVGFQGTAYIGSLRRTVSVQNFRSSAIRINEWVDVSFEFYCGPEFVRRGMLMFFRSGTHTKGVGRITEVSYD